MLLWFIFRNRTIEIMYFVSNEAGVSLVPGLAVPRPIFPKLSIINSELVNFI